MILSKIQLFNNKQILQLAILNGVTQLNKFYEMF